MTNKEIAERLRGMVYRTDMIIAETLESHPPMLTVNPREVLALADELDPPRPKAGTVIQFASGDYGIATNAGVFCSHLGEFSELKWEDLIIKWWPARILAPGQVAVTIPPVSDWPKKAGALEGAYHYGEGVIKWCDALYITRGEAERMEAE